MKNVLFFLLLWTTSFVLAHNGFEQNEGQILNIDRTPNTDVLYKFKQENLQITLRKNGFSYELLQQDNAAIEEMKKTSNTKIPCQIERIDFLFPQSPKHIISDREIKNNIRYFNEQGSFQPKYFQRIYYKEIAADFDIEFLIIDGQFKYNIHKSKDGQLKDFYIKVKSAGKLSLINEDLSILTDLGQINEQIPVSYIGENKETLKINFNLDKDRLSFKSNINTDHQTLIIDPLPDLVWSTFIGGSEYDITTSTTISDDNSIYITGITTSSSNISTSGAFQSSYQGDLDIFISKFTQEGDIEWSSYYGGPQAERIYSIVENNGYIYLAGCTFSNLGIVTSNPHQSTVNGADDIFLLKMDSLGNRVWCTYHGGNDHDFVTDMIVENDTIFMVGHTRSMNNIATNGVHLENFSASEAGHITLFDTDGNHLIGTYFGAENNTSIQGITRLNHKIFITGRTNANNGIATTGSHQEIFAGFKDGFLAKFNPDGTKLWGTYFGGDYSDVANAIASTVGGEIIISGNTSSTNQIATPGVHQETRLSPEQGFIANFNENGHLNWATYAGGNSTDYISVMNTNKDFIFVGGQTLSDEEIGTPNSYQSTISTDYDGFVQAFDLSGNLQWGTYLGGNANEDIASISVLSNNLLVAGSVDNNSLVFGQGNSHSDTYAGGVFDGFLVYLCQPETPQIIQVGDSLTVIATGNIDWYYEGDLIETNQESILPTANGDYTAIVSQQGKCSSNSDTLTISTIGVSVENHINNNTISIYPNPAKNKAIIAKPGKFSGTLFNLQGKEIYHFKGEDKVNLNTTNLEVGTYLVHIQLTDNHTVLKLQKN
ncbi:hypothetical protein CW751_04410 [Brumimicrobium salinarum]|uniref:Uncharacterized protein n=1 Tax=Brumimicrobium salinarum TaxID=2058658 RepID=A0A2I0R408_9FLAO|nr:T9SS type A sorting domain-containing protein [Brumimicrobium salinarum]PKR81307.1 hypothetical protein CW751_04410 [Brumimicrobium salinarum]